MGSGARELFFELIEKPPEERERLLMELCQRAPALHRRVRKLLEAHDDRGPLDRALSRDASAVLPGTGVVSPAPSGTVLGEYEILGELGSGGAGVVYRARHLRLNRIVALKFLRMGEFATEREVQRFRAEAEAVARLDHPNIVPVFEVGEIQGRHYFSMKLIEGGSLAAESPALGEDPRLAARLLVATARAVHHAHRRGLLHRDLKPSNILLDEKGVPHVADFGVAKRIDSNESLTASGWICGTPAYMAPEQVNPSLGEVTVQTDVYAMGCILYQTLTGRPPFGGETAAELFRQILELDPHPISSLNPAVPRDLETICSKCLDKSPERRYSSMAALADDLELWLAHKPIRARKSSLPERLWLAWRRKPVVVSLAAAVALLVVVLALGASAASLLLQKNLDRARRAEAEARARLRTSLIAQARANRKSRSVGQREESLKLLVQAASIRPGGEILNEAVSAFALTDLRLLRTWSRSPDETMVAFAPRFDRCAVGFEGGRIEVRSVRGATIERELPGFGPSPFTLVFSADSRFLAAKYHGLSTSEKASVRVWDIESEDMILDEAAVVSGAALGFDSSGRLAIGAPDGRLRFFDLKSGKLDHEVLLPAPAVKFSFRSDGPLFAAATGEGRVSIHDSATGRLLKELRLPGPTLALDWSEDGNLLAVASGAVLRVFDATTWHEVRRMEGHNAEIVQISFSSAAPLVATYAWDGSSRIWNRRTGEALLTFPARVLGFSRDGHHIGFSTRETLSAWEVLNDDMRWALYGHSGKSPTSVAFSPDDRWLASGGRDGLWLWDIAEAPRATVLTDQPTGTVAFHPKTGELYACTDAGLLRWNLPGKNLPTSPLRPDLLLEGSCGRAAINASGRWMALTRRKIETAEDRLEVILLDLETGKPIRRIDGVPGIDRIDLSPGGDLLAAGNWRGDGIHVIDTRDGSVQAILCRGSNSARGRFSPDGRWLVTATGSETQVWEVGSWRQVHSIPRPEGSSNLAGMAAFTSDSTRLAVTPTERTVELIEPVTWRSVVTLEASNPHNLADIRFSGSGSRLAAASPTNGIEIWELERIQQSLEALHLSDDPNILLGILNEGEELGRSIPEQ